MSFIYRVDMSTLTVRREEAADDLRLLGGRALTSRLVAREVDPTANALGAGNKLVFAPGLLGGTAMTTSGRVSFGGRSPLTGGIKEANVGGQLGHRLARLGVKAVVVEGEPPDGRWRLLRITRDGGSLEPADGLAGLGNYDAMRRLLAGAPRTVCAVTIGPAGEHRLAAASIAVTDPEGRPTRHAARGGLGAVMGAKGLKAMLVDDGGAKSLSGTDAAALREAVLAFSRTVLDDPRTKNMSTYGTAGVIRFVNRDNIHSMPTRNHRLGTFAGAGAISGQRIAELAPERGGKMLPCMAGCIIKCAILFNDRGGAHVTTALEFETLALLGSNLEIDDLDAVARMDRLCDDIGLDTIETGNAFGVAMEAGVARFGDWQAAIGLLEEIRRGTPLGRVLGSGAETVAKVFGVSRVPAVRGQGIPAWEPRTLKAMGITYATSPMGADHTAGLVAARGVPAETLLEMSRHEQTVQAAIDSVGLCQFSNPVPADMAAAVSALYGVGWTEHEVLRLGWRCLLDERDFNRRAGFLPDADALPAFLRSEPLRTADGEMVFDVPDDVIAQFWDWTP